MLKRTASFLIFFLIIGCYQPIYAATDNCTKPKVAVKLADFDDGTLEVLQRQYPFQTKQYWLQHIQRKMLEKLRANSPGIDIFPETSGGEYDYYIHYSVAVIGCGEQEKIGDLLSSKDTCYWVHGTLHSHDACGIAGVGFRSADIKYKDVDTAITLFALQMGNIEHIAAAHERERPIPPRGPQVRFDKEPQSVSPLDGERETTVDARVTNCRGEPVYDKLGKRYGVVAGPKQGQRGETHPVRENASLEAANAWRISPNAQGGAALKYELKKGIKAGTETLTFIACGLGAKAEKKQVIEIYGLEIRAKARKSQLKPGEDTQIDIEFMKVSASGERKPIPFTELSLKIEGLKDGVVRPKDNVSTNAEGRAVLVYQAGQNDRDVRITAFYQPQKYPDEVEGSTVITVQEGKGDLSVQINGSLNWVGEDNDKKGTITTNFTISGTMTLHQEKHGGDYENYEIENLQMNYFHHAEFHNKKPDKHCPHTVFWEVHGEGSAPIQKGRIIIRYPRDTKGKSSSNQAEFDLQLSSGPLPTKWRFGCGGNQTRDNSTSISVVVVDQKSLIVKGRQEYSGSRTFGIIDLARAFNLAVAPSLPFGYNDNESIGSSLPLPNEIGKIIAESARSVEEMRMLATGITKEGNHGRLTWTIRKTKNVVR